MHEKFNGPSHLFMYLALFVCVCLSGRCGEKDTVCAGVCVTVLHRGVTADGNVQGIWCKSHKTELLHKLHKKQLGIVFVKPIKNVSLNCLTVPYFCVLSCSEVPPNPPVL